MANLPCDQPAAFESAWHIRGENRIEVLEAAWLEATKEAHASFEAWEMMPPQHSRRYELTGFSAGVMHRLEVGRKVAVQALARCGLGARCRHLQTPVLGQ